MGLGLVLDEKREGGLIAADSRVIHLYGLCGLSFALGTPSVARCFAELMGSDDLDPLCRFQTIVQMVYVLSGEGGIESYRPRIFNRSFDLGDGDLNP